VAGRRALRVGALFCDRVGRGHGARPRRRGPAACAAIDERPRHDADESRESAAALAKMQEQVDEQEAMLDRAAERLDALEQTS
jgi:hypothetical protein